MTICCHHGAVPEWEIKQPHATCMCQLDFSQKGETIMSSLSDKIAEARRQEEESARVQQEESSTEAVNAEKQKAYSDYHERLSDHMNEFASIVQLVFQTNDDGTMADNFDIDSFEPEHAEELVNAFEHMLDTITGTPKTRRVLFTRKQKESKERKPRDLSKIKSIFANIP